MRWFVVEMKHGDVADPKGIAAQLQEGATAVERHAAFGISGDPDDLVPLVLHGGRIHAADVQVLQRKRQISFRGKELPVVVRTCGTRLADLT